jgi:hypothetical protein
LYKTKRNQIQEQEEKKTNLTINTTTEDQENQQQTHKFGKDSYKEKRRESA